MYKYLILSVLVSIIIASCNMGQPAGANGIKYRSSLEYNNYIMERQKQVVEGMGSYTSASQGDLTTASRELDKAVATITNGLKDIQGMSTYDGDSSLRDAAANLFAFYKKSFTSDFREMLLISKKVQENTGTPQDIERYKLIQQSISKTEGPLDEKMKEAQVNFAKKYNLVLSDHSLQDKIDHMKTKTK